MIIGRDRWMVEMAGLIRFSLRIARSLYIKINQRIGIHRGGACPRSRLPLRCHCAVGKYLPTFCPRGWVASRPVFEKIKTILSILVEKRGGNERLESLLSLNNSFRLNFSSWHTIVDEFIYSRINRNINFKIKIQ